MPPDLPGSEIPQGIVPAAVAKMLNRRTAIDPRPMPGCCRASPPLAARHLRYSLR
jgi:hypothetical protein